jgi:hypothetical protein
MKLILVVRVDLGLGRGKVAAQSAHAAVVSALANLGTPDFRAWLRDGSLRPRRAAVARNGPLRKPNGSRLVSPGSLVLSNCGYNLWAVQDLNLWPLPCQASPGCP